MYDAALAYNKVFRPEFSLIESLLDYNDENCVDLDAGECYRKVVNAEHGGCLIALNNVWFKRADPKKHLVWLYGMRNSGKSSLIKYLEKIFCS